jgi:Glycosyl transferase family 2
MRENNSTPPFVTCIMPTMPERFELRAIAMESFELQTYPLSELICDDSQRSIGAKRNWLCSIARGDIIIHWDDDDWSDPRRIEFQVEELMGSGVAVTGFNRMLYYDVKAGKTWLYEHAHPYALGTSLCYRKSWWLDHPFDENVKRGEDTLFCRAARHAGQLASHPTIGLIVAQYHGIAQPRPKFNCRQFSEIDYDQLPKWFKNPQGVN